MNIILIIIAVFAFSLNSIMGRCFQVYIQKYEKSRNLYLSACSIIASVAFFALSSTKEAFVIETFLYSVGFGVCFAITALSSFICYKIGSMSVSSVIINLSMLIPIIFSLIVFDEKIDKTKIIGFILIFITFIMSCCGTKQGMENFPKWLIFMIIAFIANGMTATIQKIYKINISDDSMMIFMGIAYLTSGLVFLMDYIFNGNHKEFKEYDLSRSNIAKFFIFALLGGVGSCIGNGLLSLLCTRVLASVLYPCINGGLCIVTSVVSFVVFNEKKSNTKVISIFVGVLAIIFLNI